MTRRVREFEDDLAAAIADYYGAGYAIITRYSDAGLTGAGLVVRLATGLQYHVAITLVRRRA